MENTKQIDLPKPIDELLQLTPSGIIKLQAVWSGLSTETQILILSKLDEMDLSGYFSMKSSSAYFVRKIRINALDSKNAYVRYLAARKLEFFSFLDDFSEAEKLEEERLKNKIENDLDPLVKYSLLEDSSFSDFDRYAEDPSLFFSLPQEARLAMIRTANTAFMTDGNGKNIASILLQAIETFLEDGTVTKLELYEILADFIIAPGFLEKYTEEDEYDDGWGAYNNGKDIESLWRLVPKIPDDDISFLLINKLPEESGMSSGIPEDALQAMTRIQLARLLHRKDIGLEKLRKELFWDVEGKLNSSNSSDGYGNPRPAAVSCNFRLDYDEFAAVLAKPMEDRISLLKFLWERAWQLNPWTEEAIEDILSVLSATDFKDELRIGSWKESWRLRDASLPPRDLIDLRLYRLARSVVPWDADQEGVVLSEELSFLAEKLVSNDTWATFMAFVETWPKRPAGVEDRLLPRIYEIGEDDWESEEPGEIESNSETIEDLIKGLEEKLSELLSENQEKENDELLQKNELAENIEQVKELVAELATDNRIRLNNTFDGLRSFLMWQQLLLCVTIVLVIWLLIVQH